MPRNFEVCFRVAVEIDATGLGNGVRLDGQKGLPVPGVHRWKSSRDNEDEQVEDTRRASGSGLDGPDVQPKEIRKVGLIDSILVMRPWPLRIRVRGQARNQKVCNHR